MDQSNGSGPYVGKRLSTGTFVVDDAVLADYYGGLELEPPSFGFLPSTIASGPDGDYFREIAFANQTGHLWMREEWALSAPMEAGVAYRVEGDICDIYDRRNRVVVDYRVRLKDGAGRQVLETHHHQSFLRDQEYAGDVELRDPGKKPGARRFDVPEGERFGGLERTISLEMCGQFFHGNANYCAGSGRRSRARQRTSAATGTAQRPRSASPDREANYHTDKEASRELGFQDVVVGGRMTMGYVGHILEERFGEAWWRSGSFDLKFTNPVWPGDTITANGVVTGADPDDPARTAAFVWIAKADGTIALIARAGVAA